MSEAKTSKGSKAKSAPAPKSESKVKSESAAPKAKDEAASTPSTSPEAKTSDSGKESGKDAGTESGKDAGTESDKSARESIGGKDGVHYGYFSSVRTPAYRSGWDSIWGSNDGSNGADGSDGEEAPHRRAPKRAAKARKRREPITVTLDLDALPPSLKDGLVEIARAELRKSRVSYERRDKAGAIDWRITCRVD